MRKLFRYVVLILVGLGVGLAVLWGLGGFQASKASPAVVSGPPPGAARATNPVTTTTTLRPASPEANPIFAATSRPSIPSGIGNQYLALGDSVAYGVGAPVPNDTGYAGLFYNNYLKRLQPDLTTYRNFAVPGETSSTFISPTNTTSKAKPQLQRALEELEAAAKAGRRVSPITLTLGGNDMLEARGKSQADREAALTRFDRNLGQILDQLKAKTGQADLFVTTYYNPYAFNTGGEDLETGWVKRFNEVIRKRATERQIKVADFFEPINGRERALTWSGVNDVHPNPAGHIILAQALWRATGYDVQPPNLALTYYPVPADGKVSSNERLIFKVGIQDEWAFKNPGEADTVGAGAISTVIATLDETAPTALTMIPPRLNRLPIGAQEYSYVLDTNLLGSGRHKLRFEARDAAGNIGSLEIIVEVV